VSYPTLGTQEVFGASQTEGWTCTSPISNVRDGCLFFFPADVEDTWEMERMARLPKLGRQGLAAITTTFWLRRALTNRYRVRYTMATSGIGSPYAYGNDTIAVDVDISSCLNSSCTIGSSVGTTKIYYNLVSDFVAFDSRPSRAEFRKGYFDQFQTDSSISTFATSQFCAGWEQNGDAATDAFSGYNLRWPDSPANAPVSATSPASFIVGDVVPLDWRDQNSAEILGRLAPNRAGITVGAGVGPDYRVATYLNDLGLAGDSPTSNASRFLRLQDESRRPIFAFGSTPVAASLQSFETWYDTWKPDAELLDADWNCRQKYVIFLTDGDETCGGTPATVAGSLAGKQIKTFVVAFGVNSTAGNQLDAMAIAGGTTAPIYPQNKDELVATLKDILSQIRSDSTTFASASLPAVQSSSADQIFLSSFRPGPDEPRWPGVLDAFRQPLPLDANGRPDTTVTCGGSLQSACHLWEAGAELLKQVPTEADLTGANPNFKIGLNLNQRRVFYGRPNIFRNDNPADPQPLSLMFYNNTVFDRDGLLSFVDSLDPTGEEDQIKRVIRELMQKRNAIFIDADTGLTENVDFVMGDVFHSNPLVIEAPSDFGFFVSDLCGTDSIAGGALDNCVRNTGTGVLESLRGYRNFVRRYTWRRRMMVTGNNDGQLHFFDAGIRDEVTDPTSGLQVERYNDGTGREIFAYTPSMVLPIIREQNTENRHIFSMDGELTTTDAFIDPLRDDFGLPLAEEREWRTVLVGGLREGGDIFTADRVSDFKSGYFALDVTHPDELNDPDPLFVQRDLARTATPTPEDQVVPSCIAINSATGKQTSNSDCATISGDRVPFPHELWTFTDQLFVEDDPQDLVTNPMGGVLYSLTEEGDGLSDLADTWSKPVVGQVRFCDGVDCDPTMSPNDITTLWVAIFGGGFDPELGVGGNWLYMVDMETGATVYKRQLDGMVPSAPAVVDVDEDGILDLIYIGTTDGYLYKVDMRPRDHDLDGAIDEIPSLQSHVLDASNLADYPASAPDPCTTTQTSPTSTSLTLADCAVTRLEGPLGSSGTDAWEPFIIFDTADASVPNGRPFFLPPTSFFIPERDQFGLAFGAGDRSELWSGTDPGRYYVVVDDNFAPNDPRLPLYEADLEQFVFDGALTSGLPLLNNKPDLILRPRTGNEAGWVMTLPDGNRSTTNAFILSGILIFSVFEPETIEIMEDLDGDGILETICSRGGITRFFVVDVSSGEPVAPLSDPLATTATALVPEDRFQVFDDFTTAPFVTQVGTKNPDSGTVVPATTALQAAIRDAIKGRFPSECQFNDAFAYQIETNETDTGIKIVATIPIAVCPSDWKVAN
jgi:Tfp pilus tip-associated adhesin PilY1